MAKTVLFLRFHVYCAIQRLLPTQNARLSLKDHNNKFQCQLISLCNKSGNGAQKADIISEDGWQKTTSICELLLIFTAFCGAQHECFMSFLPIFLSSFCVAEEYLRFGQDMEISFLDRLLLSSSDLNIYAVRISVHSAGVKLVIGLLIRYKRRPSSKDSLQWERLEF